MSPARGALVACQCADRYDLFVEGAKLAGLDGQEVRASGVRVLALSADACLCGEQVGRLTHVGIT